MGDKGGQHGINVINSRRKRNLLTHSSKYIYSDIYLRPVRYKYNIIKHKTCYAYFSVL